MSGHDIIMGLVAGLVGLALIAFASRAVDLPDYCGKGPVEIGKLVEIYAERTCDKWGGDEGDSIRWCEQGPASHAGFVSPIHSYIRIQRWTDYPECGGERIDK